MKSDHKPSVWYREPMVWLVLSIPGCAVLMGAIMLTLAVSTYDGLVTDDYYEKGLQINRSMERDSMAEGHGLAAVVSLGASGGVIEVHLEGIASFVPPEVVNLRLFHATRPGIDLHLALRGVTEGRYLASRPELAPGRWYLQLDADGWRLKGEIQGTQDAQRLKLGLSAAVSR